MSHPATRLPVVKSPAAIASEHVGKAFDAIRRARSDAEALKREAEAKMREQVVANLRIVIDARRSHLKLGAFFESSSRASLSLETAVAIEDGTNTDERDIGIYVRTVAEALVVRSTPGVRE